jgi:DNA-binding MarR family transcriptional regulator
VYILASVSTCYCTSIRAATRRVTALYDEALRPVGVNVAQFGLLRNLSVEEPKSIQELATALDLERSTVARNIRVLEKLGLVELGGSSTDRRAAEIRLNQEGTATLQHGEPLWVKAQTQFEMSLATADAATALRATLHAVCPR